jgi:sulfite reductase alpha subunit-like flavoprotein
MSDLQSALYYHAVRIPPASPSQSSSAKSSNMLVKDEDDTVSMSEALEALSDAVDLLKTARVTTKAWQDPIQLLDATARSLDDAALALKNTEKKKTLTEEELMEALLVEQKSQQVIAGRQAILDATAPVFASTLPADDAKKKNDALIVWATHTGTSKKLARQLKENMGADAVAMNIRELSLAQFGAHRCIYFIVSTFGRGRPPRDAEAILTALQLLNDDSKNKGVLLFGLEFGVAALGNSIFGDNFCCFGRTLSQQLRRLGAQEALPIATMDAKNGKLEQQRQFGAWQNEILIREGKEPILIPIAKSDQKEKSTTASCCIIL